jgi:adenine deaminase
MDSQYVIEGNLVDVVASRIYPARITISSRRVISIEETQEKYSRYILPGLIDSHTHIESSLLTPARFAEIAAVHGVTSIVADPHEIANVLGMKGVVFMIDDGRRSPIKYRFVAPSCVPATSFETSGATLSAAELRTLLARDDIYGLGEMMNYPGVIFDDKGVWEKLKAAREVGKPIDGHAPGLSGKDLAKYVNDAGVSTDHECTTYKEAKEKAKLGMIIQVREGTACKDMDALKRIMKEEMFFFATDDVHAEELTRMGYIDYLLKKAVSLGVDPMKAVKAATLWPAEHYRLNCGYIGLDTPADIVVVDDLKDFKVREVYIDGVQVSKDGKALFETKAMSCGNVLTKYDLNEKDLYIPSDKKKEKVRVICAKEKSIISTEKDVELEVRDGAVQPSVKNDVLLISVTNRYFNAKPSVGFISGFKLKKGAVSSTIAHDSHNIITIATSYRDMAKAINAISGIGGHYATDGEKEVSLALPVAGLMSSDPVDKVIADDMAVTKFVTDELGCAISTPFLTMGFQALLVVPALKMSDKGLFDSSKFKFTTVIVGGEKDA